MVQPYFLPQAATSCAGGVNPALLSCAAALSKINMIEAFAEQPSVKFRAFICAALSYVISCLRGPCLHFFAPLISHQGWCTQVLDLVPPAKQGAT